MNLRELAVTDMRQLNIKDWSLSVELTDPDGVTYTTDNVTGDPLKAVQILYDYRKLNPDTGEEIVINEPVVTMARTSLARVPLPGENWYMRIPVDPSEGAPLEDFVLNTDRSPEGGRSLGFIRLYPTRVVQS